ncbi:MAG: FISUMP domain-containing protein [Bacteroidota bacterium]
MNKLLILFSTAFLIFLISNCSRTDSPEPVAQELGYLSLNVALQIEALPTSGRIEAVSPDNFLVTIHDASDGAEVMRWDTYDEVPAEVQLPTGSYFVRATNLEFPADAAFEQPWYFGESDVFTIDKEELETIEVECTLANCKISFNYSQNVQDNFTNWDATATIDDGAGTGGSLNWMQNDPTEGYFLTDLPIDIEVYLEYVKEFEPDMLITRTFNHTISDPVPATHYMVNVDATLEDGKVVIDISVNEDFETVEIPLGEEQGGPNSDWVPGEQWIDERDGYAYGTVQIGDQIWMAENLRATELSDNTPIPNVVDRPTWAGLTSPGYAWYNNDPQASSDYGILYNWYVIETGKACPSGWRMSDKNDWDILIESAGGISNAGNTLKEVGFSHWTNNMSNVTNSLNFTALPGGFIADSGGSEELGRFGFFWTATETSTNYAYFLQLSGNDPAVTWISNGKNFGLSIRCIKN